MDDYVIFILAILLILAIPVAVIYLLISNAQLKRRVTQLEGLAEDIPTATTSVPKISRSQHVAPKAPWPQASAPDPERLESAHMPSNETETPPVSDTPALPASQAVVFNSEKMRALTVWLTQNWFYAASAVSLALAGIFLVLYGMEQGLLPPSVRILASTVFGSGLIAAGEYIRRRFGDSEDSTTAYLPSTFSGAGLITLFGTVLSARLLYDFIGPEMALISIGAVGIMALVLGWFNGPLLASVGIVGATIAPFVVGGSSDDPSFLLAYFGTISVVGLAIDTLRRWAWVSVVSLFAGFGAAFFLAFGAGGTVSVLFPIYCVALAIAAIAIPVRKWVPDHDGAQLGVSIFSKNKAARWPEFPTRLAGGSVLAASVLPVLIAIGTSQEDLFWSVVISLSTMGVALLVWARNAPALVDLTVLPAGALVFFSAGNGPLWRSFHSAAQQPEAAMPVMATSLLVIATLLSVLAAWRALQGGKDQTLIALGAAVFAPAVAIAIEMTWSPALTLGAYSWALHAMVLAGVMVVMAERFARADGPTNRLRASFATLSALACIAFGLVLLFSAASLTTAIVLTIVAAAWLDQKYDMPLMGLYLLTGVAAVGYRLVIGPGVDWAVNAPLLEMLLSHGGAVVGFSLAYLLVKSAKRPQAEILLESAFFSSLGVFVSVVLYRMILGLGGETAVASHWSMGLGATIWMGLAAAQLRRTSIGGRMLKIRQALSAVFGTFSALQLLAAVTVLNPLSPDAGALVLGLPLFNTLIPAYLLPAVGLAFVYWWLTFMPLRMRQITLGSALALGGLWLGLTIRHFWQGGDAMALPGIHQAELYTYTVVLLLIGAGLFYQSLKRQNTPLRRAGLIFIGLAVAKVFVWDIRDLGGLIRIFSLLFLGFSLSGLAWLNRWAATRAPATDEK